MDVVFTDTATRCRKVVCSYRDFQRAETGAHILVVSFDGKKIYGVIIQEVQN